MSNEFGLISTDGTAVPLISVKVRGDVTGRGSKVRVAQRFKNRGKAPVEAVYKFPLPETSAVCGFEARLDGRTVRGLVEEREKAFEDYDNALAEGNGGYLLDEERPNIFTLSVGNLNPGAEAVVEIEYVALLDSEGSRVRFFLPTTISPRYVPDHMPEDDGIPENERVNPTYAADVSYGLSLSLNVHGVAASCSVESPSHPVKVDFESNKVHVELSTESARMDHDFILYIDNKGAFSNKAYRCLSNGEQFMQLDLCLTGGTDGETRVNAGLGKEIIFLLDCSGSMQGDSISQAKKALEVCLRGMEQGTSFNVWRFGSSFQPMFPQAERYNAESLQAALERIQAIDADLGGTEILAPLQHLYQTPPSGGRRRFIILITDGEVGNDEEVVALVRANQDTTSFFTLGIGAGPNEFLIKGAARAGCGVSEFLYPGERIEPKVLQIFGKIRKGQVDDLTINWDAGVEQAPHTPVIFVHSPVTLLARCKDHATCRKIVVQAKLDGQPVSWEVDVVDVQSDDLPLPVLWARERIRDLEESSADDGGSRQSGRKQNAWKEAVLRLSKTYGVLSTLTSFVAIEERPEELKTKARAELRKVPVLVTQGWHGFDRMASVQMARAGSMPAPESQRRSLGARAFARRGAPESLRRSIGPPASARRDATEDEMDLLLAVLSLQRPEGGFILDSAIARRLGIHSDIRVAAEHLEAHVHVRLGPVECRTASITPDHGFIVLSTAIVLRLLETRFAEQRATWKDVVAKSRSWLDSVIHAAHPRVEGAGLHEWVRNVLEP